MTTQTAPAFVKGKEYTIGCVIKDLAMRYNAEGQPEYELQLEAPFFQSQYPTTVTVPDGVGQQLRPGMAKNFILKVGNLRKRKDGGFQDGTQARHYFWNFSGLAGDGAVTDAPPQAPARSNGAAPQLPSYGDEQRRSIELQVVFKEARAAADRLCSMEAKPAEYVEMWEYLFNEGVRIYQAQAYPGSQPAEAPAPAAAPVATDDDGFPLQEP